MAKGKTICNVCEKQFDMNDECLSFGIHRKIGYGSKYDGDDMDLDLCCDCADKFIDEMIKKCKISPIITDDVK